VVTDFGLARGVGAARTEISGSLYTTAPEVLLGEAPTPRADLFALGVMLHELFVGRRVALREF
jgi:serine/threonine-protein kinase